MAAGSPNNLNILMMALLCLGCFFIGAMFTRTSAPSSSESNGESKYIMSELHTRDEEMSDRILSLEELVKKSISGQQKAPATVASAPALPLADGRAPQRSNSVNDTAMEPFVHLSISIPLSHKKAVEEMGKMFNSFQNLDFKLGRLDQIDEEEKKKKAPKPYYTNGQIRNFVFDRCLDSFESDSAQVTSEGCHGNLGGQRWRLTGRNNLLSWGARCLDAEGLAPGGIITAQKCNRTNLFQQWDWVLKQVPLFNPVGIIRNRGSKLCMVFSPGAKQFEDIRVEPCKDTCTFYWFVDELKNTTEAKKLTKTINTYLPRKPNQPKIMCWVMTDPKNLETKSIAVNKTWAPHCDILRFMTTVHKEGLNTVALDIGAPESREMLWRKAQKAWIHTYEHYRDQADWFMRVDDDSYVMMENLRNYLSTMSPDEIHFIGRPIYLGGKKHKGFYSGGAGNIMSRAALVKFGEEVLADNTLFAPDDTFADDAEIAYTLANIGIRVEDTRDKEGRHRFFPLGIDYERVISKKKDPDHWFFVYSPDLKEGVECCSKRWLISHYTNEQQMIDYDDGYSLGCEAAGRDPDFLVFPDDIYDDVDPVPVKKNSAKKSSANKDNKGGEGDGKNEEDGYPEEEEGGNQSDAQVQNKESDKEGDGGEAPEEGQEEEVVVVPKKKAPLSKRKPATRKKQPIS